MNGQVDVSRLYVEQRWRRLSHCLPCHHDHHQSSSCVKLPSVPTTTSSRPCRLVCAARHGSTARRRPVNCCPRCCWAPACWRTSSCTTAASSAGATARWRHTRGHRLDQRHRRRPAAALTGGGTRRWRRWTDIDSTECTCNSLVHCWRLWGHFTALITV